MFLLMTLGIVAAGAGYRGWAQIDADPRLSRRLRHDARDRESKS